MKKIFILLMTCSTLLLVNCKNSKTDETNSANSGMKEVQIKINGNSLSLMVPVDSTKGKPEVTEQSWGATEIKVGKDFQISITEGPGDIALAKSDIAGNDVNKFKRYIKDEPTVLFWESQITGPEFHFYLTQKAGQVSYLIEDIKGDIFNEKQTQAMIDAAKSLKVVEAAKPNS